MSFDTFLVSWLFGSTPVEMLQVIDYLVKFRVLKFTGTRFDLEKQKFETHNFHNYV